MFHLDTATCLVSLASLSALELFGLPLYRGGQWPFLTDVSKEWDLEAFDAEVRRRHALGRGG